MWVRCGSDVYSILQSNHDSNMGIKHDFPFINIHEVPRGALKTEGVAKLRSQQQQQQEKLQHNLEHCAFCHLFESKQCGSLSGSKTYSQVGLHSLSFSLFGFF